MTNSCCFPKIAYSLQQSITRSTFQHIDNVVLLVNLRSFQKYLNGWCAAPADLRNVRKVLFIIGFNGKVRSNFVKNKHFCRQ